MYVFVYIADMTRMRCFRIAMQEKKISYKIVKWKVWAVRMNCVIFERYMEGESPEFKKS